MLSGFPITIELSKAENKRGGQQYPNPWFLWCETEAQANQIDQGKNDLFLAKLTIDSKSLALSSCFSLRPFVITSQSSSSKFDFHGFGSTKSNFRKT